MAGGATLPWVPALSKSEQPEMPLGFYWGGEVAAALAAGYAKFTFIVFSWYPLLVLLGPSSSFSYSTGTSTGEDDESVALGLARSFLGS